MTQIVNWVLMVTSAITASGVIAILGFIVNIWTKVKENNRTLHGADGNEGWNGLVPKVHRIEEILEEEGYL